MCPLTAHLQLFQSSLCLHPVSELLLLCFYIASLWLRRFFLETLARSICSIFPLCMESNALEKSTNDSVISRILTRTPKIQRIVKICDVVDRFLRKPI